MIYLDWGLRLALGVMFAVSAVSKARSGGQFAEFRETVRQWSSLPRNAAAALAVAVLAAEAAVPVLLAVPETVPVGYALAAALLAAFDIAIVVAWRRGLSRPCHCFGTSSTPPSGLHVAGNLALCVAALTGYFGRMSPHWGGTWKMEGSMPYLIGGFAVLAILTVLNLVLTMGVVRRIRDHAEHLNRLSGGGHAVAGIEVGATVGGFAATTVDGEAVADTDLSGTVAVAFFSPDCRPCAEQLPKFLAYAAGLPSGSAKPLAVVVGDPDEAVAEVERLRPLSRVVVEPIDGPVARAFGVSAYPTLYLLTDGSVVTVANAVNALPVPTLT